MNKKLTGATTTLQLNSKNSDASKPHGHISCRGRRRAKYIHHEKWVKKCLLKQNNTSAEENKNVKNEENKPVNKQDPSARFKYADTSMTSNLIGSRKKMTSET